MDDVWCNLASIRGLKSLSHVIKIISGVIGFLVHVKTVLIKLKMPFIHEISKKITTSQKSLKIKSFYKLFYLVQPGVASTFQRSISLPQLILCLFCVTMWAALIKYQAYKYFPSGLFMRSSFHTALWETRPSYLHVLLWAFYSHSWGSRSLPRGCLVAVGGWGGFGDHFSTFKGSETS